MPFRSRRSGRQYLGWQEFSLRFTARHLAHGLYRFDVRGAQHLPKSGPALLIANHLSYIDWLFVATASPRPVRFVMHHQYTGYAALDWVFRVCEVIPIAPAKEDPNLLERSFDQIAQGLLRGDLLCIFPEGELTRDGQMGRFRPGLRNILSRTPVPVIPMALENLWDSVFSLNKNPSPLPHRIKHRDISLNIGEPIPASQAKAMSLADFEQAVRALRCSQNDPQN